MIMYCNVNPEPSINKSLMYLILRYILLHTLV